MVTVKDPKYNDMIEFLRSLGTADITHSGEKKYLGHLIAVHRDLLQWGAEFDVARAGMFHSIYGTQIFQGFTLPITERSALQDLIGFRAEFIAFLNCFVDRSLWDTAIIQKTTQYCIVNRETGESYQLERQQWDDLILLHLCDWMEQLQRMNWWDYRREGYRAMADHLGGVAKENYLRVLSSEPDRSAGLHVSSEVWLNR